jgi:hypothetical protein
VRTAYLVAHVDVSVTPPVVAGVGVYSEEHPTTIGDVITFCLMEARGEDYGHAVSELNREIARMSAWHPHAKLIANSRRDDRMEWPDFRRDPEGEMAALQKRMVELDREMGAPAGAPHAGGGA